MSYDTLVLAKVRQAFRLAGDLVYDVTLLQANTTGFDFTQLQANKTTIAAKIVKALFIEQSRKTAASNTITAELMFITADTSDLTKYDRVLIKGEEWKIVEPIEDNRFTVTVTITKDITNG